MKTKNVFLSIAAGSAVAAVAYKILTKRTIPEGAEAVHPFDTARYMGTWYEVARMPSLIEKNLTKVIEEYALNDDGTFNVVTKAYNALKDKWTNISGTVKPAKPDGSGMLKVSYFKPVYFAYNVLDIDPDYRYALVSSAGLGYLWILSRETTVPDHIKVRFLKTAKEIGFNVDKLEWIG